MSKSVHRLFSLADKTALVTGASRGLGLQIAFALGEAGAKVLISSRKVDDLVESVKLLHQVCASVRVWLTKQTSC